MDKEIRQVLEAAEKAGWWIIEGKHYQCFSPDGQHLIVVSRTPSTRIAIHNIRSDFLRRAVGRHRADGPPRSGALGHRLVLLPPLAGRWHLDPAPRALRGQVRRAVGRAESPRAAILESQRVKTTEKGGFAAMMRARK